MKNKIRYLNRYSNLKNYNRTLVIVVFLLVLLNIGQAIYTFKIMPRNQDNIRQEIITKTNTITDLKRQLSIINKNRE